VGPVGSGKTTGIFFKLVYMAKLQKPSRDGIRRTRAVIVRNTMPQLRDTTLSSWNYWFKHGQAGTWHETDKKFTLRFDDVECEVLFRPLDSAEDVARVLSLEVTFAIIDEFVEIPREIIDALSARCGRYPSKKVDGGATNWGMWGSSNPSTEDNWWFDYLHNGLPDNALYFLQPSASARRRERREPARRRGLLRQSGEGQERGVDQAVPRSRVGLLDQRQAGRADLQNGAARRQGAAEFQPGTSICYRGSIPASAAVRLIFGQEDLHGRLLVLGELIQQGYGAEAADQRALKPVHAQHFPGARHGASSSRQIRPRPTARRPTRRPSSTSSRTFPAA
jgi:hypothetical protein